MISETRINRYVKTVALIQKLERLRDALRREFLDAYAVDEPFAETGPYLIEIREDQRKAIPWKAVAEELASVSPKAKALLDKRLRKAEVTTVQVVTVKNNPDFKSKT